MNTIPTSEVIKQLSPPFVASLFRKNLSTEDNLLDDVVVHDIQYLASSAAGVAIYSATTAYYPDGDQENPVVGPTIALIHEFAGTLYSRIIEPQSQEPLDAQIDAFAREVAGSSVNINQRSEKS